MVVEMEGPKTWRLLKVRAEGEPNEELVFVVYGVLIEKNLPPLTAKPK